MSPHVRVHVTRILLIAFGLSLFVVPAGGFVLFPAGFRWEPYNPSYEKMIVAIYVALALCFLIAARDPVRHRIIVDFGILSSVTHGGVMAYDALVLPGARLHLITDVALLFMTAALFWIFYPPRDLPQPSETHRE